MAISSFFLLPLLLLSGEVAASCNADNCLRALRAPDHLEAAIAFCGTFTTSPVTATSAIPSFAVAACTGNVASRVSSVCSCIATASPSTTTTSQISTSTSVSTSSSVAAITSSSSTSQISSSTSIVTSSSVSSTSSSLSVPSTTSSSTTFDISTSTSSSVSSLTSSSSTLVTSTSSAPSSTPTFPAGPKTCMNPQLSCQNTIAVEDLCCFNAPGGQLLLTQFWDTAPSTGPNNSWTLHGLWPDHCDGTYDANCDASREYTNITAILKSYGKTDLLAYMNVYWKDYQGNDESFWEHEWDKHGTCISTLEPSCYNGYTGQEEVVDFFDIAVRLFKGLDSYATLEQAGITPSTTATYTFNQIQAVLTAAHGFPVTISCSGGALDEIWYHYNVLGSVQTGEFVPTSPDGSKSDCPATGIKYVPKYLPVATPTTTGTAPTGSSTGVPYAGKGFLQATTGGTGKGCLISAGTWYTTGTCATYSAAAAGAGFTLTSSKGPCDIIAGAFSCAVGNTAGVFTNIAGLLGYGITNTFHAAAIPAGSVQQKVYVDPTAATPVNVTFMWQGV